MNRSLIALALAGVLGLGAIAQVRAGTVYLMNDEEIDGEIVDVGVDYVVIKVGGGKQSIPLRDVRDVEFRPGESIWEKKLKTALQRSKDTRERERREKAGLPPTPPPVPIPLPRPTPIEPLSPQPVIDTSRLPNLFESEKYHFSLRYPSAFKTAEPESTFFTFKDDLGGLPWSFNVTYFDTGEESDFDLLRNRAQGQLDLLKPHYQQRGKQKLQVGRFGGERTTGIYERAGRSIRHDQIVVPTRRGVLVIHFFSPGATLDDNAVPDVEAVIGSLQID